MSKGASKGQNTRTTILTAAVESAATEGLESLTIGRLAERVGLSKSGLFAHFRSKEALQLQVLEHARRDFAEQVLVPAIQKPRGEPRLRAILESWLAWGSGRSRPGGCVFLQAAAEYDDRPGPVRDALVQSQRDWIDALVRATELGVEVGHFRPGLDARQFAFEYYGLMMAHHFHSRLLEDPAATQRTLAGLDRLLENAR